MSRDKTQALVLNGCDCGCGVGIRTPLSRLRRVKISVLHRQPRSERLSLPEALWSSSLKPPAACRQTGSWGGCSSPAADRWAVTARGRGFRGGAPVFDHRDCENPRWHWSLRNITDLLSLTGVQMPSRRCRQQQPVIGCSSSSAASGLADFPTSQCQGVKKQNNVKGSSLRDICGPHGPGDVFLCSSLTVYLSALAPLSIFIYPHGSSLMPCFTQRNTHTAPPPPQGIKAMQL